MGRSTISSSNEYEEQIVEMIPEVNPSNEFLEIASDFGNSLEIVREAISNAYDWGANYIKIKFKRVNEKLVITFEDDGIGMGKIGLQSFWNLGDSKSKKDRSKIGEKGHGTKIYLRADKVEVTTQNSECRYKSVCIEPKEALLSGNMHKYTIEKQEKKGEKTGAVIVITGYDNNEMAKYTQDNIKDYIYWFTKLGSVEKEFKKIHEEEIESSENELNEDEPESLLEDEINDSDEIPQVEVKGDNFSVYLQGLDRRKMEKLEFGHKFAEENSNLTNLKSEFRDEAAQYYVKKYLYHGSLENHPDIKYDLVINIEADKAKRKYNNMIREKLVSTSEKKGKYKVADRYGLWLTKDYIPIERKNDWISGFGNGSNSILLLHAFLNCQDFRLTANRGSVTINQEIEEELKNIVSNKIKEIDIDLAKNGLWKMLADEKREEDIGKIIAVENNDYRTRIDKIDNTENIVINNRFICYTNDEGEERRDNFCKLKVPNNESELFGVFMMLYTIFPDKFEFEVLDYNTVKGIDILVRKKANVSVSESSKKYLEMKYLLSNNKCFNHTFRNINWIICWDFDNSIKDGIEMKSAIGEFRTMSFKGNGEYYLEGTGVTPIKVIKLREFAVNILNVEIRNN